MPSRLAALVAVLALGACIRFQPRGPRVEEPVPNPRALTPRDLTGSSTAYDEMLGEDSLFQPRIFRLTSRTIGVSLARPAHVAVLQLGRCGPVASVPGHDLSRMLPAGDHYLALVEPARGRCDMQWWRPMVAVIAAELPLHGEVLEERAREARESDAVMAGRTDRWAIYAVYRRRL